jgi:microcystin-dependent protein
MPPYVQLSPLVSISSRPLLGVPEFPWLLCNGSAVSRKEFPELFSVIGEIYRVGDGCTTFNLPDYRNRVPMGSDRFNKTGALGGASSHTLSLNELPAHSHGKGSLATETSGEHTHPIQDPGHTHTINYYKLSYALGTSKVQEVCPGSDSYATSQSYTNIKLN